jgi:hypothetical protein
MGRIGRKQARQLEQEMEKNRARREEKVRLAKLFDQLHADQEKRREQPQPAVKPNIGA